MLPPQQHHSNKRTNHHRGNHIGYHPYYSSSPVGISNANIHYVSTSSVSSSTTASIASETLKTETTLTQNNINRHNNQYNTAKYSNDDLSNSQNNNTLQDDENDISYISTKTNPPTTPVSLSSVNNTPSTSELLTSPICSFKTKNFATEPTLNVTPVTSISSASSVSNMKLNHYSASCSSSCSSSVDSTCSSVHATFSRSGSMNSLNSFDIKSTYSSIPSEYSCNNKQENCAGFMTPSSYSDLPDSPGELFPTNIIHNRFINSSSLNNSANNQQRYLSNNKLMNQTSINEISVMTVDSNPSKSNDITIVERTVLACTAANSSNNTQLMATYGNSGCSTFNQDELNNNNNTSLLNEDDERVVSYDVEGSLCESHSNRSNVSSLTFPSEPTADLAFIRNLLTKKGSLETATFVNNELLNATKTNNQIQTKQWSNYSNKTNLFTPPIKLNSNVTNNQNLLLKTNKKLLYEDDEYGTNDDEVVVEEEDDCARSIASLPSDIVRDSDICLKQNKFNALFSKLTNNLALATDKNYESSPLIINNKANLFNSKKQNQSLDNSMNFSNNQSFNSVYHSSLIENNTNCQEHLLTNKAKMFKKNDEDDEKILQDFIDEMLPIAMANKKVDEYDETDESVNEQDEEQLKKFQKIYENNLENHVPLSSILPKIEEEDEDDDYVPKMREKLISKSTNTSKAVVVQMTKTTRLRVNKLLQSKSISNALSSSNKKTNQIKENFSSEKKQALSNSASLNSISSKCSNLSTKSSSNSNVSKKLVLTQSNKLNMIKPTTKRSNLLEKK